MRLIKKIGLTIVPVLICGKMFYSLLVTEPYVVFPKKNITIVPITDIADNGMSESKIIDQSDQAVTYTYTLQKGFLNPYAGVCFYYEKNLDLSVYDQIKISIQTSHSSKLRIFIHTLIPGYTDEKAATTFLFNIAGIRPDTRHREYTIPLKSFKVPFWWYVLNKKNKNDPIITTDFSWVKKIEIQNYQGAKTGVAETVTITNITFDRDPLAIIANHALVILIYLAVFAGVSIRANRKKAYIDKINRVTIPYRYLEIEDTIHDDALKILDYLDKNFKSPDLTINMISSQTGVPEKKIPFIIKKSFGSNFPHYLNVLRLNEAKKLLKDTDKSIIDIAFYIGYNSSSYFNYLFKKHEGLPPNGFRSRHRSHNNA